MAAIVRKPQSIFGSSLVPAGNLAIWGSLLAGAPAFSSDPTAIQSAAWLNGLNAALVGNRSPAVEDLNALFYVLSYQIAYILQSGIPEYDAATTYWIGQTVRVPGTPFRATSLSDNNIAHNPATDSNNWSLSAGSCAAAANFGGGGTQVVPVDGGAHKLLLNGPYINGESCYDGPNSKFVAPVKGNYVVTANVQIDNSGADAGTVEFALQAVNQASAVLLARGTSVPNPAGNRWYPGLAGMVVLNAADELSLSLTATAAPNAGNVNVSNSDWSIHRV